MTNPLTAYFTAAYPFQDKHLRQSFQDFLESELSKGPYFQAQLPYASITDDAKEQLKALMPTWNQPFLPCRLQF